MKYLDPYKSKDELSEKINDIVEEYYDLITESRFGDWMIKAPKIRRLQERANQLRLRAVRAEGAQKRQIDYVIKNGGRIDAGRMWALLQQKLDAWEDSAREFEMEADELAGGSDYLRRVRRIAKMKGTFKINKERLAVAEFEERREIMKANSEISKTIRQEERIISDKTDAEKLRLDTLRQKMHDKSLTPPVIIDNGAQYFDNKRAEEQRREAAEEREKALKARRDADAKAAGITIPAK